MRLHLIILLGIFTLSSTLLVSCKKKKKGEVTMEFQLTNDEGNMALNSDFINDVGNRVVVEKLWLYFGNITFIKSDGEECLATEVELLQIDSDGKGSVTFDAPHGTFSKIQFGLGVPEALNNADPSTYAEDDHPLNTQLETYWGMAGLYRFLSIEGRFDIENDDTLDGIYAYHTGFDDQYRIIDFEKEIVINKKENTLLSFDINIEQIMDASGNAIDVVNEPFFHGMSDFHINSMLTDNLVTAITLN